MIDPDRKVIGWNKAMVEMTGIPREEIPGKGDYAYAMPFYGDYRPVLIDLIDRLDEEVYRFYPNARRGKDSIDAEVFTPQLYHGRGGVCLGEGFPVIRPEGSVYWSDRNGTGHLGLEAG